MMIENKNQIFLTTFKKGELNQQKEEIKTKI